MNGQHSTTTIWIAESRSVLIELEGDCCTKFEGYLLRHFQILQEVDRQSTQFIRLFIFTGNSPVVCSILGSGAGFSIRKTK